MRIRSLVAMIVLMMMATMALAQESDSVIQNEGLNVVVTEPRVSTPYDVDWGTVSTLASRVFAEKWIRTVKPEWVTHYPSPARITTTYGEEPQGDSLTPVNDTAGQRPGWCFWKERGLSGVMIEKGEGGNWIVSTFVIVRPAQIVRPIARSVAKKQTAAKTYGEYINEASATATGGYSQNTNDVSPTQTNSQATTVNVTIENPVSPAPEPQYRESSDSSSWTDYIPMILGGILANRRDDYGYDRGRNNWDGERYRQPDYRRDHDRRDRGGCYPPPSPPRRKTCPPIGQGGQRPHDPSYYSGGGGSSSHGGSGRGGRGH